MIKLADIIRRSPVLAEIDQPSAYVVRVGGGVGGMHLDCLTVERHQYGVNAVHAGA